MASGGRVTENGWKLTPRQERALADICDTFCPGGDGVPTARELGVPAAVQEAVALNPRASERRQLAMLLSLWDTPVMGALGGAGLKRFGSLPSEERERVLLAWGDATSPQRRAVFHALRKAALLFYYMLPGAEGRNPAWDAIGYDGPLGQLPDAPPKALQPEAIGRDTTLDCDAVIVGSGAGGGAAAGVLGQAGLDVVVIEAGDYYDDEDFDGSELGALTRYYMGAPNATHDQSVGLLAGACLGGGTVVNYTTSFRTPDDVRDEWAGYGVPAFTSEQYTESLDAVCERLGVSQEYNTPSTRERKLQAGCVELGWHVDAMPRGVRNCAQGKECGYCGLGCRVGAKQSVVKTWLADATQAGSTRVVVRTKVDRVLIEAGAARGVQGRTVEGHAVTVRARAVIVASGAIHTPALLRRSGLQNPNIGRHLKLHPANAVWGIFDEELKTWEGVMQALYSDQHRDLHDGYGVKYETAANHPHLFIPFVPWRSQRQHFSLMQGLGGSVPIGVLLRDRDGGEVRVGRDGEPVVRYALSPFDTSHLRTGIEGAAQILEAAGAQRIISSQTKWVSYDPGVSGSRERFMAEADAAGYGPGQVTLGSFHIMGSARVGGSPASSACDPTGQTWDVRSLYVMDGSSFPTASGVNPQISIQAIAHMNSRELASRLA
jgi:choline dehydrogenase-like flavoprotein